MSTVISLRFYFLKNDLLTLCHQIFIVFLIGKTYSIDDHEMTNVLTFRPLIGKHKLSNSTNIET